MDIVIGGVVFVIRFRPARSFRHFEMIFMPLVSFISCLLIFGLLVNIKASRSIPLCTSSVLPEGSFFLEYRFPNLVDRPSDFFLRKKK